MVDLHAHEIQALHGPFAGAGVVFADAGGEDDGVHAAHGRGEGADVLLEGVGPHFDGQLGVGFSGVIPGGDVAHVGIAGQAQQTALLVHHGQHFGGGHVLAVADEFHHGGVKRAAAGAHHQAVQRGDAHAGVHALAVHAGGQGGAVAQVADDDLVALGQVQQLLAAGCDVAVAGAVEAVLADVQIGVILIGNGIAERLGGHGLVEGGVEHGHLGHVRQHLLAGADAHQVGGVVQRAQGDVFLDGGDAGFVDQAGGGELLAAVQHAVAHRADLLQIADHADAHQMGLAVVGVIFAGGAILAHQHVQHHAHGLGVGLGLLQLLFLDLLIAPAIGQVGGGIDGADALHQALGDHGFVVHVDQLELQGGRTGVDDQNFHNVSLLYILYRGNLTGDVGGGQRPDFKSFPAACTPEAGTWRGGEPAPPSTAFMPAPGTR